MNNFVELRHLRYVLAVAEELHFARAASRLNLAAPSLSKQIKQLEQELGFALFERQTRAVVLTRAGRAFVAEAKQAINHVARAIQYGFAANADDSFHINVGYSPWLNPTQIVAAAGAVKEKCGINVSLRSTFTRMQIEQLHTGQLHAGVLILPLGSQGFEVEVLQSEPLSVALPSNDTLAVSGSIKIRDLGSRPFISLSRALKPNLFDRVQRLQDQLGYKPMATYEVTSSSEILELVGGGVGIGIVRSSLAANVQVNQVAFRRCWEPELAIEVGIAWRPGQRSEEMGLFIEELKAGISRGILP